MFRHLPSRTAAFLICIALFSLPSWALKVGKKEVALRILETAQGDRVVLEFARRPEYQVRQEQQGVVIRLKGSFRPIPFKRKLLESPALNRFYSDRSRRKTDLIFEVGPDFATVSIFEMENPFRIVLDFQLTSMVLEGAPPGAGEPVPIDPLLPGIPPPEPLLFPEEQAPRTDMFKPPVDRPGIRVVVVDAGHGGEEMGARGPTGLLEKDVALDVSRRIQRSITRRLGLEVILTRDSDRQLSLDDRTAIANHHRADLFLSIHVNASLAAEARGAETYFLSYQATDDEARTAAALENNSIGLETPAGSTDLRLILWDLAQTQYLQESSELADTIQQNLNNLLQIESRGIKQAPFRVLMGATMPAVLVEIGFITNPEDEERLRDEAYREQIARAIVDSVLTFKERTERRLGL